MPIALIAQISGRVVNEETGEGVAFATISLSPTDGLYTDLTGGFSLENESIGNSIIVSCVGFKMDTILVQTKELKISLLPKTLALAPIVISDGKIKSTRVGAPKKRKGNVTFWALPGSQWALFVPAEAGKSGSLMTMIHYQLDKGHLSSSEAANSFFRIHLYENNAGFPGRDLLGNMIVHPDRITGWQSIDISKFHLMFPKNGLFISMEWLPNAPSSNYEYSKIGSKEKFTGTQYGFKLNGHEPSNSELKTFYYNPSEGKAKWFGGKKFPNGKFYIPCLALDVIEL